MRYREWGVSIGRKNKKKPVKNILIALVLAFLIWLSWALSPFAAFALHPFKLLGFGGEKNYLVLFQNNYELRPTGGFISAFATLTIKNAIPVSFKFEDVYGTVDDHPYVAPPAPVGKLLAHANYKGHTFRDANFYPDFPASVAEMEKFLRMTRPSLNVDGVLAVDVSFLKEWLGRVGSQTVEGKKFESSNLLETIERSVADVDLHDLNALAQRKMIFKNLAKKLAWKSALPWNAPAAIRALVKSFEAKHAIAYFKDEDLEKILVKKNWGGVMDSNSGEDFLGIVDANYGGAKSNRYVQRTIFYNVDLEAGKSFLDMRYDNPNTYSIPLSTDYKSYIRAFVPGDHVVKVAEIEGRDGKFAFAGQTAEVPVMKSADVHFEFEFPRPRYKNRPAYRLNLWKQPGVSGDYYQINIKAPVGMRVSPRGANLDAAENVARFQGFLNSDTALIFDLESDNAPPAAIEQMLKQLNLIEIQWNEEIDPKSLDFANWRVTDTNYRDSETDVLSIDSVETRGGRLLIKTAGMTAQPEEKYILEIVGVGDFAGNKIGKRIYSFFQRL